MKDLALIIILSSILFGCKRTESENHNNQSKKDKISNFKELIFTVDNFSNEYYGKILIDDTSEVFSKGWVAIYDKKSHKELIKVTSDELALSLHEGKVVTNINELPYGEQSLIIYNDFNFDGIKDFAIEDGQNSCYHGPSFSIYLANKGNFVFNEDFTLLAQEYCGMFDVNYEKKKINTMTKDGCCWHQYSEFIVEDNKPKAIKIIEEGVNFPFNTYTEKIWNGHAMVEKTSKTIDLEQDGITVILSFTIEKNNKKVILYNLNDRILNYAFLDKDGQVEFIYPVKSVYENPDFKFLSIDDNKTLSFSNGETKYKIYEIADDGDIGIEVITNGKAYDFKGGLKNKVGTLNNLQKVKLENVVTE